MKTRILMFLMVLSLNLFAQTLLEKGNELYYNQAKYKESLKYYEEAMYKGDSLAQVQLGKMYFFGKGVAKDKAKAEYFVKGAMPGLKKKLLENDPFAEYIYGYINEYGIYVDKNVFVAFHYYQKAAYRNQPIALNNLGTFYSMGKYDLVKEDDKKAIELYKKSAELGNPIAMHNLGTMYEAGDGTEQNDYTALEWYKKASKGYPKSKQLVKELEERLGKNKVPEEESKVIFTENEAPKKQEPKKEQYYCIGAGNSKGYSISEVVSENDLISKKDELLSKCNNKFGNCQLVDTVSWGKTAPNNMGCKILVKAKATSFIKYNCVGVINEYGSYLFDVVKESNIDSKIEEFVKRCKKSNYYTSNCTQIRDLPASSLETCENNIKSMSEKKFGITINSRSELSNKAGIKFIKNYKFSGNYCDRPKYPSYPLTESKINRYDRKMRKYEKCLYRASKKNSDQYNKLLSRISWKEEGGSYYYVRDYIPYVDDKEAELKEIQSDLQSEVDWIDRKYDELNDDIGRQNFATELENTRRTFERLNNNYNSNPSNMYILPGGY